MISIFQNIRLAYLEDILEDEEVKGYLSSIGRFITDLYVYNTSQPITTIAWNAEKFKHEPDVTFSKPQNHYLLGKCTSPGHWGGVRNNYLELNSRNFKEGLMPMSGLGAVYDTKTKSLIFLEQEIDLHVLAKLLDKAKSKPGIYQF